MQLSTENQKPRTPATFEALMVFSHTPS